MRHKRMVPVIATVLVLLAIPATAHLIQISELNIIADRSTLVIRLGHVEGYFALKLTFGHGPGVINIGLVFEDRFVSDIPRLNIAVEKLLAALNDPKRPRIEIVAVMKEAGFTFKQWVQADQVK